MKILAVGGADVAMDWNGVAVGAGNDNNWTRTALCNNLDSVKNFAYMRIKRNISHSESPTRLFFKKKRDVPRQRISPLPRLVCSKCGGIERLQVQCLRIGDRRSVRVAVHGPSTRRGLARR